MQKSELQRTIQELQNELLKSRAAAKESLERAQELERRIQETEKHFEESMRTQWNETTEPTRRELASLRSELMSKSDQVTRLQQNIDEEQLKRFDPMKLQLRSFHGVFHFQTTIRNEIETFERRVRQCSSRTLQSNRRNQ